MSPHTPPTAHELRKQWSTDPRWEGVRRDFDAQDVVRLRGSVHVESTLARRGAEKLWHLLHREP
jgi:isocitrate lyase